MCRPRSLNSCRSLSGSRARSDIARPSTPNSGRYARTIRSLDAPRSARCGRRARLDGSRAMMAARGNRRWPPGVVKLATCPRSAHRRSVPWLMPSNRLASPRLSHELNSPGSVSPSESGEISSRLSRASQIYAGSASTSVRPSQPEPRIIPTHTADSLRWMRPDALLRLMPLTAAVAAAWLAARPRWLGVGLGWPSAQLGFGLTGLVVFFIAACLLQLALTRRRGSLLVPASGSDAALQTGYYLINAPIEEAFFRGL